ncbi:MAG: DNA methyltransferase [Cyanobacteria bacterium P01_H01_bin.58]
MIRSLALAIAHSMTSPVTLADAAALSNNKLQASDRAFHDWYRFVLSYPPHLVRYYIEKFGLGQDTVLLDPFCGTGTTLVEAKKNGITSVGVEAVPMSHFACRTKTRWSVNLAVLDRALAQVLEQAQALMQARPYQTFDPDQAAIIVKNSICEEPLHQCLTLRAAIATVSSAAVRDVFNLALAQVTVHEASNLKFGPEVGIRRKRRESVAVLDCWCRKVEHMVEDLAAYEDEAKVSTHCHQGDARSLRSLLAPNSIDAVITSPPYPNEKDYTRTTRLESVLLGFLNNKRELRAFKQSLMRSNTRNVYKVDDDDQWLAARSSATRIAHTIEERRLALNKTSGFERLYHRVIGLYFGGMKRHLLELQASLKPGAKLAYVVGDQASFFQVMVRTGELLAEIAAEVGYEVEQCELFRTRLATATGQQLREEVVILRWPGAA